MITRRRFLTIAGGSAAAAALGAPTLASAGPGVYRWKGIALGAEATILIAGSAGPSLVADVRAEIDRLEAIFSLYRAESALSRLNRDGALDNPPFDLLSVLGLCDALHARTRGAFDPTVQPVWRLNARCREENRRPTEMEQKAVRMAVGLEGVEVSSRRIGFVKPGMALTLNGIAQGYITDRVADLMRDRGVDNVLVDLGEVRALGVGADQMPWRVGLGASGRRMQVERSVTLTESAIAVSEPLGTVVDDAGRTGHIFNPQDLQGAPIWRQVAVEAPTAALADGLSTAFCLMSRAQIADASDGVSIRALS